MMGQRGRPDEEIVLFFKVFPCNKDYNHDFAACFNTHPGDKARRRCLLQHSYGAKMCPEMKNNGSCSKGDDCHMTHSLYEYWLHPQRYRTKMCKDARGCNRPFCFFAHHESEIRAPSAAPQPLPCYADILAKTGGEASSSMAAAVAAAAAAEAGGQGLMPHVPAPPTPSKNADCAAQHVLLRQLSPPQQQLQQQQVLGLSLDACSSCSLFRGCSDMLETATLLKSLQSLDSGAGCMFGCSISDPGDNSCSTGHSSSSNALPVLDLPPGLDGTYAARSSIDCIGSGPVSVPFFADSVSPVPALFMQGGIGAPMLGQQQQQQQQFLPIAGVSSSSSSYQPLQPQQQPMQPLQLASIDPAALSAMLQRLNVTSPDMQQQLQPACSSLQLQVPVSQPQAMYAPQQQQPHAMYAPHQQQQQQQDFMQLVSASAATPLAAPPGIMYAATSTASTTAPAGCGVPVRPQLLMPVAAGGPAGVGLLQLASPSGLQQQLQLQQLPATGGIEVCGFAGQQYILQQLQW